MAGNIGAARQSHKQSVKPKFDGPKRELADADITRNPI
jgi:hypothetical protein